MNKQGRRIFFLCLVGFACLSMLAALSTLDLTQNRGVTFVPLLQILGKAPQSLSRSVTKILPIDSVDEGELGQNLRSYYERSASLNLEEQKTVDYLNSLMRRLQRFKQKPFDYVVYLSSAESPNAMAFPGGNIIVTSGLLKILKSESELVAVLAHELGHIELSHCFDSVKYEILTKKLAHNNLGALADFSRNLLLEHAFSKTQEDEADSYGFGLLTNSEYDPMATAKAFQSLQSASGRQYGGPPNLMRDYFMSHPPLEHRIAKFSTEAQIWWGGHAGERRYIGVKNLQEKMDLSLKDFGVSEWTLSQ